MEIRGESTASGNSSGNSCQDIKLGSLGQTMLRDKTLELRRHWMRD